MAASTYLDVMAGNKWDSTLKSAAVSLAVAYTGVADASSDQTDVALALLALKALQARDQSESGAFPTDFTKLMTDEIQSLLGDVKTSSQLQNLIRYSPVTDSRNQSAYEGGR